MSRSHGDLDLHSIAGLSASPDVCDYVLTAEDQYLLVCSDGVWTYMSYDDAVTTVMEFEKGQAMEAAQSLAKASRDSWLKESDTVDDITVLCIQLGSDDCTVN